MSLQSLLFQSASVRRRATTAYVDGTPIRSNFTEVATYPARVSPSSGGETVTTNSQQRETYRSAIVFLPPDAEVLASDVIVVDDVVYEAVYPRLIYGPRNPHHVEVDVRVVEST